MKAAEDAVTVKAPCQPLRADMLVRSSVLRHLSAPSLGAWISLSGPSPDDE